MPYPLMMSVLLVIVCPSLARGQAEPVAGPTQEEEANQVFGAPSEIDPRVAGGASDLITVEPGARLHQRPDPRSPTLAMIDARIDLSIIDRREHWVRVRYGSWKGWIATSGVESDLVAEGRPAHAAWRLALAREMLASGAGQGIASALAKSGPFSLHTDVQDRGLLRMLSEVSSHLPAAYRERYGLEPPVAADDALILFSREQDYRAYEAEVRPEADRGALGHAAYGLAVLYVGRQGPRDVAAVLVHELTHVLSHRVMKALPPWLDEGVANDLAFCRIDGARRLKLGSLGGRSVVIEKHSYRPGGWLDVDQAVYLSGPSAARDLLDERWRAGGTINLRRLSELSAGQFFDPDDRRGRYDASTFLVRYLLSGESGELATGFRAFLAALAAGESVDSLALAAFLGRSWAELEHGFAAWLNGRGP